MSRKLSKKDVANSSSVFWAHGDSVLSRPRLVRLPYTKEDLRGLLNYHALFSEHLCVLDVCLLNNEPLRELIMFDSYDLFLSSSVVIPMMRSSASKFRELDYQLRQTETYGMSPSALTQPYAQFLDEKVSAVLPTEQSYFEDALTVNFERSLLHSRFLAAVGLSTIEDDLLDYCRKYKQRVGTDKLRRSVFFYFADELAQRHPRYAARLKWLSSAIYNNTFVVPFELKPALPHTYSEALLMVLTGARNALRLEARPVEEGPLGNLTIRQEDLCQISPKVVLEIRKKANPYFNYVKKAARQSNPSKAEKELHRGLENYLPSLGLYMASVVTGKRERRSRLQSTLRVIKWSGLAGGAGFALVSLLGGPLAWATAFGGGLLWRFGAVKLHDEFSKRLKNLDTQALLEWEAMRKSQGEWQPIIHVSQTRGGVKPPLF